MIMATNPSFFSLNAPYGGGNAAAANAVQSIGSDTPMNADPFDPLPSRYVIRDIGYEIDESGSLQFLFRNPGRAMPFLPGDGIDNVIALLTNPQFQPSVENYLSLVAAAGQESPLDINLQDTPAYIIFRLPRNGNLYFAPGIPALTHKNANDAPFCAELRHVGVFGATVNAGDGCKLLYFMAKPKTSGEPPTTDEYRHSLNIKTRLLQKPHYGSSVPRILDIVIDPDIRHPGGSTT
jgi:hypothetical protein